MWAEKGLQVDAVEGIRLSAAPATREDLANPLVHSWIWPPINFQLVQDIRPDGTSLGRGLSLNIPLNTSLVKLQNMDRAVASTHSFQSLARLQRQH